MNNNSKIIFLDITSLSKTYSFHQLGRYLKTWFRMDKLSNFLKKSSNLIEE